MNTYLLIYRIVVSVIVAGTAIWMGAPLWAGFLGGLIFSALDSQDLK